MLVSTELNIWGNKLYGTSNNSFLWKKTNPQSPLLSPESHEIVDKNLARVSGGNRQCIIILPAEQLRLNHVHFHRHLFPDLLVFLDGLPLLPEPFCVHLLLLPLPLLLLHARFRPKIHGCQFPNCRPLPLEQTCLWSLFRHTFWWRSKLRKTKTDQIT